MATYATGTTVPISKSRDEIEKTLTRYGATAFAYGWDDDRGLASVQFAMQGRQVRLMIPTPNMADAYRTPTGQRRSEGAAQSAHEAAKRQRWRAMLLIVKAKLEAVESGIVSFEQEFLAHMVLPTGATVYEDLAAPVEEAYLTGAVRPLAIGAGNG